MPNFKKLLNKKNISIFVVFLILSAGGLFFWWQTGKEIKGSPDDYVIKETAEGTFVENKKAGLVVKMPEGWEAERIKIEEGAINFNSPNLEVDKKEGKIVLPLRKGCKIQASVEYEKLNFADIKIELRYSFALMGMKLVHFEEVNVNNYPALKSTFDLKEEGPGVGMSISIPSNSKVYGFSAMWGFDDKESCIQEFNKFLETISINPNRKIF